MKIPATIKSYAKIFAGVLGVVLLCVIFDAAAEPVKGIMFAGAAAAAFISYTESQLHRARAKDAAEKMHEAAALAFEYKGLAERSDRAARTAIERTLAILSQNNPESH